MAFRYPYLQLLVYSTTFQATWDDGTAAMTGASHQAAGSCWQSSPSKSSTVKCQSYTIPNLEFGSDSNRHGECSLLGITKSPMFQMFQCKTANFRTMLHYFALLAHIFSNQFRFFYLWLALGPGLARGQAETGPGQGVGLRKLMRLVAPKG